MVQCEPCIQCFLKKKERKEKDRKKKKEGQKEKKKRKEERGALDRREKRILQREALAYL